MQEKPALNDQIGHGRDEIWYYNFEYNEFDGD